MGVGKQVRQGRGGGEDKPMVRQLRGEWGFLNQPPDEMYDSQRWNCAGGGSNLQEQKGREGPGVGDVRWRMRLGTRPGREIERAMAVVA